MSRWWQTQLRKGEAGLRAKLIVENASGGVADGASLIDSELPPSDASLIGISQPSRQIGTVERSFPLNDLGKVDTTRSPTAGFCVGSSEVRQRWVGVRRFVDEDENAGFEIMLHLVPSAVTRFEARLDKAGATTGHLRFFPGSTKRREDDQLYVERGHPHWKNFSRTKVLSFDEGAIQLELSTGIEALNGAVRIQVRGDDREATTRLQKIVRMVGLNLAPVTDVQLALLRKHDLLSSIDSKAAATISLDDKGASEALDRALDERGALESAARLESAEVAPGYFATINPGVGERSKKLGALFLYSAVWKQTLPEVLVRGQRSMLARLTEGIVPQDSEWKDLKTGGAFGVFTRLATQAGKDIGGVHDGVSYDVGWNLTGFEPTAGDCALIYDVSLLERVDMWGHADDEFGRSNNLQAGKGTRLGRAHRGIDRDGWGMDGSTKRAGISGRRFARADQGHCLSNRTRSRRGPRDLARGRH